MQNCESHTTSFGAAKIQVNESPSSWKAFIPKICFEKVLSISISMCNNNRFPFCRCSICDRSYLTLGALKTHMKKHIKPPVKREKQEFICDICLKKFTSKDYLKRHFQWHSQRNKSDDEQYTRFIAENFDLSCDICHFKCATFYEAKRHYKDAHDEKNGYIKCCNLKLHQFWRVTDHINSSHLNPKMFK